MNDREISAHAICNSLLLDHHGFGEKEVYLHADNCIGQNKNSSCTLQYLCWRCMTKQHTKAMISFLVVGQTKFSHDWCP